MKALFIPLVLLCTLSYSQCLKYSDLQNAAKKPEGKFTWYVAKNGEVFNEGDKVTVGKPSGDTRFNYFTVASTEGLQNVINNADAAWSGRKIEIKKIKIVGTKATGFSVELWGNDFFTGYLFDIENALTSGEIVSSIMSSDQALSELKKAKDKLDLGLITQAQYDSTKAVLAVLIK